VVPAADRKCDVQRAAVDQDNGKVLVQGWEPCRQDKADPGVLQYKGPPVGCIFEAREDFVDPGTPLRRALAHEVGADDAVGTDCERDGERLLPRMARPACVADGKKQLVLAWLAGRGVAPAEATVYTDNGIDLPLLEVVGEPVAVNADAELAAEAARRGWRAESWTTTRDAARPRSGESWPLRR